TASRWGRTASRRSSRAGSSRSQPRPPEGGRRRRLARLRAWRAAGPSSWATARGPTRRGSRSAASSGACATRSRARADDASWERLEEALLQGDVGVRATAELVRRLEQRQELGDLNAALADEVAELLGPPPHLELDGHRPAVILVVGVNGTGKTTTIGKLAQKLREHGREVTVGAADTFRAA